MVDAEFEVYPEEWWHYTLKDEPYPDNILTFPLNKKLGQLSTTVCSYI